MCPRPLQRRVGRLCTTHGQRPIEIVRARPMRIGPEHALTGCRDQLHPVFCSTARSCTAHRLLPRSPDRWCHPGREVADDRTEASSPAGQRAGLRLFSPTAPIRNRSDKFWLGPLFGPEGCHKSGSEDRPARAMRGARQRWAFGPKLAGASVALEVR
jgi:hypothetical protein